MPTIAKIPIAEYIEPSAADLVKVMPDVFNRDVFVTNLRFILKHREIDNDNGNDYKLTKVKVANRLGVKRETIYDWLNERRRPNLLIVFKVNLWAKKLREQSRPSSVVSAST